MKIPRAILVLILSAIFSTSKAFVQPQLQVSSLLLSGNLQHSSDSISSIYHSKIRKPSWLSPMNIHNRMTVALQLQNNPSQNENDDMAMVTDKVTNKGCWSPGLRRVMGGIASLGVLETSFLTYNKLFTDGSKLPFCTTEGASCSVVLNGPYAYVPFTEIPLSALGLMAYLTALGLAVFPLITSSESSDNDAVQDDSTNRILLMGVTTAMGTFSIFLLTLLFGVLHQDCPYCELSATFSIVLALLALIGGCLPEENQEMAKKGAQMTASGFLASTVFALALFVFADDPVVASGDFGSSTSILASSATKNAPPPIESPSSDRAMSLAKDLQALDAKMFGAFWCSHCYDQKETLGKQAFSKIPYIECSKDGLNSQASLCKSKEVPGYPTWEINGKLYPGEQSIEELEEVVAEIKKGMTTQ